MSSLLHHPVVRRTAATIVAAFACLFATSASAHDVTDASATLVVRDGGHVELRLHVPWADVLRAQWMPKVGAQDFLVRVTSWPPADFARDIARVQGALERGIHLVADGGDPSTFARWQWPPAGEVQEALRRELMSRLAVGAAFEHASRLAATSDVVLGRNPTTVQLRLPAAVGPALVTIYRPLEQWVKAGALSAPVAVARR